MLGGAGPASAKKKKRKLQQRSCASTAAIPQAATLQQSYDAVLCLINQERAARGLRALRQSAPLGQAALDHSSDMVARQYFAHDSLDGRTARERVTSSGYSAGGIIEEALACGWMQLSTPQALVASLMRSPDHKSILLARNMRDIGIGFVLGGPMPGPSGGATLTLDFAGR
jgi:uncharacterized protein YkwD